MQQKLQKRRIVALLLTVTMVFSLFPGVNPFAVIAQQPDAPAGYVWEPVWDLADATDADFNPAHDDRTVPISQWGGGANVTLDTTNGVIYAAAPRGQTDGPLFNFAPVGMNIAENTYAIAIHGTMDTALGGSGPMFRAEGMNGETAVGLGGVIHNAPITNDAFSVVFTVGAGGTITQTLTGLRLIGNGGAAGAPIAIETLTVHRLVPEAAAGGDVLFEITTQDIIEWYEAAPAPTFPTYWTGVIVPGLVVNANGDVVTTRVEGSSLVVTRTDGEHWYGLALTDVTSGDAIHFEIENYEGNAFGRLVVDPQPPYTIAYPGDRVYFAVTSDGSLDVPVYPYNVRIHPHGGADAATGSIVIHYLSVERDGTRYPIVNSAIVDALTAPGVANPGHGQNVFMGLAVDGTAENFASVRPTEAGVIEITRATLADAGDHNLWDGLNLPNLAAHGGLAVGDLITVYHSNAEIAPELPAALELVDGSVNTWRVTAVPATGYATVRIRAAVGNGIVTSIYSVLVYRPLYEPRQTLEDARQDAYDALDEVTATNETVESDIIAAVRAVVEDHISIAFSATSPFAITAAQPEVAGYTRGILELYYDGETVYVYVNLVIPALPPLQTLEEARVAAQTAVDTVAITNVMDDVAITAAITGAVSGAVESHINVSWAAPTGAAISITPAAIGVSGAVAGTAVLQYNPYAVVVVNRVIPALQLQRNPGDEVWRPNFVGATVLNPATGTGRQPITNALGQRVGIITSSGNAAEHGFAIVDDRLQMINGGTNHRLNVIVASTGAQEHSSVEAGFTPREGGVYRLVFDATRTLTGGDVLLRIRENDGNQGADVTGTSFSHRFTFSETLRTALADNDPTHGIAAIAIDLRGPISTTAYFSNMRIYASCDCNACNYCCEGADCPGCGYANCPGDAPGQLVRIWSLVDDATPGDLTQSADAAARDAYVLSVWGTASIALTPENHLAITDRGTGGTDGATFMFANAGMNMNPADGRVYHITMYANLIGAGGNFRLQGVVPGADITPVHNVSVPPSGDVRVEFTIGPVGTTAPAGSTLPHAAIDSTGFRIITAQGGAGTDITVTSFTVYGQGVARSINDILTWPIGTPDANLTNHENVTSVGTANTRRLRLAIEPAVADAIRANDQATVPLTFTGMTFTSNNRAIAVWTDISGDGTDEIYFSVNAEALAAGLLVRYNHLDPIRANLTLQIPSAMLYRNGEVATAIYVLVSQAHGAWITTPRGDELHRLGTIRLVLIPEVLAFAEIVQLVREAIAEIFPTNAVTRTVINNAVNSVIVLNENITSTWYEDFARVNATHETPGSLTGIIRLALGSEYAYIEIDKVIPLSPTGYLFDLQAYEPFLNAEINEPFGTNGTGIGTLGVTHTETPRTHLAVGYGGSNVDEYYFPVPVRYLNVEREIGNSTRGLMLNLGRPADDIRLLPGDVIRITGYLATPGLGMRFQSNETTGYMPGTVTTSPDNPRVFTMLYTVSEEHARRVDQRLRIIAHNDGIPASLRIYTLTIYRPTPVICEVCDNSGDCCATCGAICVDHCDSVDCTWCEICDGHRCWCATHVHNLDMVGNIVIDNPFADVNWSEWYQFRAQFHTHTRRTDGSATTPNVVRDHFNRGFDILALTDHNITDTGDWAVPPQGPTARSWTWWGPYEWNRPWNVMSATERDAILDGSWEPVNLTRVPGHPYAGDPSFRIPGSRFGVAHGWARPQMRANLGMPAGPAGGNGMIPVPFSNEQTYMHHVNTFWANFNSHYTQGRAAIPANPGQHVIASPTEIPPDWFGNDDMGILRRAQYLGGLTMINHPGRHTCYLEVPCAVSISGAACSHSGMQGGDIGRRASNNPREVERYSEWFRTFESAVGFELYNRADHESRSDRILWDNVLMELMPQGRPVWGLTGDDSHSWNGVALSWNVMLMPSLTDGNLRTSMETGAFYTVSRLDRDLLVNQTAPNSASGDWQDALFTATIPTINEIEVSGNVITITGANYDYIYWFTGNPFRMGDDSRANQLRHGGGVVLATGASLDLSQLGEYVWGNYVRAALVCRTAPTGAGPIVNGTGVALTQPFGIFIETIPSFNFEYHYNQLTPLRDNHWTGEVWNNLGGAHQSIPVPEFEMEGNRVVIPNGTPEALWYRYLPCTVWIRTLRGWGYAPPVTWALSPGLSFDPDSRYAQRLTLVGEFDMPSIPRGPGTMTASPNGDVVTNPTNIPQQTTINIIVDGYRVPEVPIGLMWSLSTDPGIQSMRIGDSFTADGTQSVADAMDVWIASNHLAQSGAAGYPGTNAMRFDVINVGGGVRGFQISGHRNYYKGLDVLVDSFDFTPGGRYRITFVGSGGVAPFNVRRDVAPYTPLTPVQRTGTPPDAWSISHDFGLADIAGDSPAGALRVQFGAWAGMAGAPQTTHRIHDIIVERLGYVVVATGLQEMDDVLLTVGQEAKIRLLAAPHAYVLTQGFDVIWETEAVSSNGLGADDIVFTSSSGLAMDVLGLAPGIVAVTAQLVSPAAIGTDYFYVGDEISFRIYVGNVLEIDPELVDLPQVFDPSDYPGYEDGRFIVEDPEGNEIAVTFQVEVTFIQTPGGIGVSVRVDVQGPPNIIANIGVTINQQVRVGSTVNIPINLVIPVQIGGNSEGYAVREILPEELLSIILDYLNSESGREQIAEIQGVEPEDVNMEYVLISNTLTLVEEAEISTNAENLSIRRGDVRNYVLRLVALMMLTMVAPNLTNQQVLASPYYDWGITEANSEAATGLLDTTFLEYLVASNYPLEFNADFLVLEDGAVDFNMALAAFSAANPGELSYAIDRLRDAIARFTNDRFRGVVLQPAPPLDLLAGRFPVLHLSDMNLAEGYQFATGDSVGIANVADAAVITDEGTALVTVPAAPSYAHFRGVDIVPNWNARTADAAPNYWFGYNVAMREGSVQLHPGDRLQVRVRNHGGVPNTIFVQAGDDANGIADVTVASGAVGTIDVILTQEMLYDARTVSYEHSHNSFRIRGSVLNTQWEIVDILICRAEIALGLSSPEQLPVHYTDAGESFEFPVTVARNGFVGPLVVTAVVESSSDASHPDVPVFAINNVTLTDNQATANIVFDLPTPFASGQAFNITLTVQTPDFGFPLYNYIWPHVASATATPTRILSTDADLVELTLDVPAIPAAELPVVAAAGQNTRDVTITVYHDHTGAVQPWTALSVTAVPDWIGGPQNVTLGTWTPATAGNPAVAGTVTVTVTVPVGHDPGDNTVNFSVSASGHDEADYQVFFGTPVGLAVPSTLMHVVTFVAADITAAVYPAGVPAVAAGSEVQHGTQVRFVAVDGGTPVDINQYSVSWAVTGSPVYSQQPDGSLLVTITAATTVTVTVDPIEAPPAFIPNPALQTVLHLRGMNLPATPAGQPSLEDVVGLSQAAEAPGEVAVTEWGGIRVNVPPGQPWEHWRGVDIVPYFTGVHPAEDAVLLLADDIIRIRVRNVEPTGTNTITVQPGDEAYSMTPAPGVIILAYGGIPAGQYVDATITLTQADLNQARDAAREHSHNSFRIRGNQINSSWEVVDILIERQPGEADITITAPAIPDVTLNAAGAAPDWATGFVGTPDAVNVTVANDGAADMGAMDVAVTGDAAAFTVSPVGADAIAGIDAGESVAISVTPNFDAALMAALAAPQTFTATITVTGDGGVTASTDISVTVNPAPRLAISDVPGVVMAGEGEPAVFNVPLNRDGFEGPLVVTATTVGTGGQPITPTVADIIIPAGNQTVVPVNIPLLGSTTGQAFEVTFVVNAHADYADYVVSVAPANTAVANVQVTGLIVISLGLEATAPAEIAEGTAANGSLALNRNLAEGLHEWDGDVTVAVTGEQSAWVSFPDGNIFADGATTLAFTITVPDDFDPTTGITLTFTATAVGVDGDTHVVNPATAQVVFDVVEGGGDDWIPVGRVINWIGGVPYDAPIVNIVNIVPLRQFQLGNGLADAANPWRTNNPGIWGQQLHQDLRDRMNVQLYRFVDGQPIPVGRAINWLGGVPYDAPIVNIVNIVPLRQFQLGNGLADAANPWRTNNPGIWGQQLHQDLRVRMNEPLFRRPTADDLIG